MPQTEKNKTQKQIHPRICTNIEMYECLVVNYENKNMYPLDPPNILNRFSMLLPIGLGPWVVYVSLAASP